MEKDIKISGRKKDSKLVKKAAEQAAAEFEKEAGYAVKFAVDEELAESSYVLSLVCSGPYADERG
jgi:hypothetical protein